MFSSSSELGNVLESKYFPIDPISKKTGWISFFPLLDDQLFPITKNPNKHLLNKVEQMLVWRFIFNVQLKKFLIFFGSNLRKKSWLSITNYNYAERIICFTVDLIGERLPMALLNQN